MKVRKLVTIALLISIAASLSIFERMLPIPGLTPGAKIGLANIITMISIVMFDKKETLLIILGRVFIASFLLGGGLMSFFYSITGGLLSYCVMIILFGINIKSISLIGISVVGGIFHNIGQILVASIILSSTVIFTYLPLLVLSGLVTGIFVGIVSIKLVSQLTKVIPSINNGEV